MNIYHKVDEFLELIFESIDIGDHEQVIDQLKRFYTLNGVEPQVSIDNGWAKEVKRLLKRKYGNPVQEGKNWKNDLYKDNQAKWSKALSLNHLEYRCSFYTKKTRIVAQLQQSDQMGIMHSISYGSLKYRDEEKKKKDEENLDDL